VAALLPTAAAAAEHVLVEVLRAGASLSSMSAAVAMADAVGAALVRGREAAAASPAAASSGCAVLVFESAPAATGDAAGSELAVPSVSSLTVSLEDVVPLPCVELPSAARPALTPALLAEATISLRALRVRAPEIGLWASMALHLLVSACGALCCGPQAAAALAPAVAEQLATRLRADAGGHAWIDELLAVVLEVPSSAPVGAAPAAVALLEGLVAEHTWADPAGVRPAPAAALALPATSSSPSVAEAVVDPVVRRARTEVWEVRAESGSAAAAALWDALASLVVPSANSPSLAQCLASSLCSRRGGDRTDVVLRLHVPGGVPANATRAPAALVVWCDAGPGSAPFPCTAAALVTLGGDAGAAGLALGPPPGAPSWLVGAPRSRQR
jgi:hypothetical protein